LMTAIRKSHEVGRVRVSIIISIEDHKISQVKLRDRTRQKS